MLYVRVKCRPSVSLYVFVWFGWMWGGRSRRRCLLVLNLPLYFVQVSMRECTWSGCGGELQDPGGLFGKFQIAQSCVVVVVEMMSLNFTPPTLIIRLQGNR